MNVKLIACTPDADKILGYVARVSNPANQDNPDVSKLLRYCGKNAHWSVFEHAYATLEIETTRDIARQILRHRSFSFSEFSQRYADVSALGNWVQRECRLQDTQNRQNSFETDDAYLADLWHDLQNRVYTLAHANYLAALDVGIAKEQARALLPEGLTPSRLYMSGTLRSWITYCQVRMDKATQKEHRLIADQVLEVLRTVAPITMDAFFPQEALDALDRSSPDNRGVGWVKRHIDAKRALRQALEDEQQNKPVARSLTDELMDCVDRLGSEYDEVDPRVWDHLLAYAPKQQDEPVAWPRDAEQVRAFMGTHVAKLRYARNDHLPDEQDSYTLSAHDFLTAVEWWADAPYEEKQQDEPVAWMFQHEETGLTEAVDVQQVEWGFEKNNPRWQKLFPLYTRPQPKRQPLTDAQIMAIGRELGLKCRLGGNPNIDFDYARAIERAHGIKEES